MTMNKFELAGFTEEEAEKLATLSRDTGVPPETIINAMQGFKAAAMGEERAWMNICENCPPWPYRIERSCMVVVKTGKTASECRYLVSPHPKICENCRRRFTASRRAALSSNGERLGKGTPCPKTNLFGVEEEKR